MIFYICLQLKATIEAHAGDLESAEAACAEAGAAAVEMDTPTPISTSSRKQRRPQEDPDVALLSTLQESVQKSGEFLKDLAAQRHPVKPTARSAFANYVKDSLLSMSDKKYNTARRDINKVLSELMLVVSDEEDMEIPPMRPTLENHQPVVRPYSAPQFGPVLSPSEQYQPRPAMWKHQPSPSSVWNSQTSDYVERYFQQPTLHQQPHQYQMTPPPSLTVLQPRQRPQQPSSTMCSLLQQKDDEPLSLLDGSLNLLDTSLPKDAEGPAEGPMNTPIHSQPPPPQDQ